MKQQNDARRTPNFLWATSAHHAVMFHQWNNRAE
jgi:hypothetical protein